MPIAALGHGAVVGHEAPLVETIFWTSRRQLRISIRRSQAKNAHRIVERNRRTEVLNRLGAFACSTRRALVRSLADSADRARDYDILIELLELQQKKRKGASFRILRRPTGGARCRQRYC